MAATVVVNQVGVPGNMRFAVADITGDSSYPTGGYAITPQQLGFSTQIYFAVENNAVGYETRWDNVNNKLMFFDTGASANAVLNETAAATNVSTVTTRLFALGE